MLTWPWRHWRQVRGETIALRLNDEQLNWRELCARVDEVHLLPALRRRALLRAAA
ncbi:hypothetical protein ACLB1Q_32730 [Escherichia coli]